MREEQKADVGAEMRADVKGENRSERAYRRVDMRKHVKTCENM